MLYNEQNDFSSQTLEEMTNARIRSFAVFTFNIFIQMTKGNLRMSSTALGRALMKYKFINPDKFSQEKGRMELFASFFLRQVIAFSRLISLVSALGASLVLINIQNTLLMLATLYFLWDGTKDVKLWNTFLFYQITLIFMLYSNYFSLTYLGTSLRPSLLFL